MSLARGDVVLARFPHTAGGRGKKRPVVVVQADAYNQTLPHIVVAEVTSNLTNLGDPAHLHIEIATPDGAATGLLGDSSFRACFWPPSMPTAWTASSANCRRISSRSSMRA